MRHIKTIVLVVVLIGGAWAALQWAARDPSVRGQDPNVETRALNTSGLPAEGTSGRAGTAWNGDEGFVARARDVHAALAARADADGGTAQTCRRDHLAAVNALEALAGRRQWALSAPAGGQGFQGGAADGHEQALPIFTQAAAQASDPELRDWAARSAAMIREHIAAAKGGS